MWFIYALTTFFAWGLADLFYKNGNKENDKYSHFKTGLIVGLVMGIHATGYMIFTKTNINIIDILKYLPVSLCYIASMVIGYKGLKYLELSISSPIQNSSGIITTILLCVIFKINLSKLELIGIATVFIGVLLLSLLEKYYDKDNKQNIIKNLTGLAVLFPIIYCLIDGLGTFLDALYLDQLQLITEDTALIAYEYTFFLYALVTFIFLKSKGISLKLSTEKNKLWAALFETLGQFTYVFAVSAYSVITVPVIACYSALSVLLSRIFLKEKLAFPQYIAIVLIFLGIILLGIVEAMA